MARHDVTLGVMAKAPVPGLCKTRMCPPLSLEQAASLQAALTKDTLDQAQGCGAAAVVLFASPEADGVALLQSMFPATRVVPQQGNTLGDRMAHALECLLVTSDRALLLGTDAPWAAIRSAVDATRALRAGQLFLGPAQDGGFWTVGVSSSPRAVFDGVTWSHPHTRRMVEERAAARGLQVLLGPMDDDADDVESLFRNASRATPQVAQLLAQPSWRVLA